MRFVVLALIAASCASPRPAATAARRGPVVVAIVVDQLASWIADERLPLMPDGGGFARLRREGTWVHAIRYGHAVTDTGPGHTALYTGAAPRDSGAWTNELLDARGEKQPLFRDPTTRVVAPTAVDGVSSSPSALRVPAVADRLRAAAPGAAIFSFSLKDRAVIPAAGRHPTAALWYDVPRNSFVTSSAYAAAFPAWAVAVGGSEALAVRQAVPWRPLDPEWIAAHAHVADDDPGEGDYGGFGTVFPHDLRASTKPRRAFRATPAADEVVIDLALAALDLGAAAPGAPTFVAISLSANDYVGHIFGPQSHEAWDTLRRVDAGLARLFGELDRRFGPDGWSAVLAADHGISRVLKTRILPGELVLRLEAAARAVLGDGPWVQGIVDPYVQLTAAAQALPAARLELLVDTLTRTLLAEPGVVAVRDARRMPERCPPLADDSLDALLCRAVPRLREPLLYVAAGGDAFFDPEFVVGKGASHGTSRVDDRSVPFLARAPGRIAAGRVIDEPQPYTLFNGTLSSLLELPTDLPTLDSRR